MKQRDATPALRSGTRESGCGETVPPGGSERAWTHRRPQGSDCFSVCGGLKVSSWKNVNKVESLDRSSSMREQIKQTAIR